MRPTTRVNPVLRGDLRARLSSPKALTVHTIYLSVLGVLAVLSLPPELGRLDEVRQEGLLRTLLIVETVLVAYFTAAAASGEISLEGDKSIEDLATSPFSGRIIGVGKVASAIFFATILVLFAVPVVSVVAGVRGEPLGAILGAGMVSVLFGGAVGALGAWYGAVFESDFTRSFVLWLTLLLLIVVAAALPEPWNAVSPVRAVAAVVREGAQSAPVLASGGYALVAVIVIRAIRERVEVIRRNARAV